MHLRALILVMALGLPAQAESPSAFVEPPVVLDGFGVICAVTPEGQRPAPGTVSGVLNLIEQDQPIDVTTVQVPAELGLSFGIRATLDAGTELPPVDVVVTHPPMGPQGQTVEHWSASVNAGEISLNLFTFEKPFELVEGPWHFQLRLDGKVLLQQPFQVTPRGTVPQVQQTCFGARLTS